MKTKNGKSAGMFVFAGIIFLFFSACMPFGGAWEYVFDNQTQYGIEVFLSGNYESFYEFFRKDEKDQVLYISPKSSKTVSIDTGSVDFEWTAYSSDNNRYIYPVKNGSKVTFKERPR
jgi:hypothetical protein